MIFYTAEEIHWYSKYYSCIPLVFYNKLVAILANRKVLKILHFIGKSGSFFHGMQFFRYRQQWSRLLSPWASHRIMASSKASICSGMGLLQGLQVNLCIPHEPLWAAGAQLLQHGLYHGLQSDPSSGTWSTSYPSFSTDLGVWRDDLLTCSYSAILWQKLQLCNN